MCPYMEYSGTVEHVCFRWHLITKAWMENTCTLVAYDLPAEVNLIVLAGTTPSITAESLRWSQETVQNISVPSPLYATRHSIHENRYIVPSALWSKGMEWFLEIRDAFIRDAFSNKLSSIVSLILLAYTLWWGDDRYKECTGWGLGIFWRKAGHHSSADLILRTDASQPELATENATSAWPPRPLRLQSV